MKLIQYLLLFALIAAVLTENTHKTCECNGNPLKKLWLDIIFVVDVSDTLKHSFSEVKRSITTLVGQISVGQEGKQTQIGLISFNKEATVIADLKDFKNAAEAYGFIEKNLVQTGGNEANVAAALLRAREMIDASGRDNVQKLVVLMTTHSVECSNIVEYDKEACRVAQLLRSDRHILLTVGIRINSENEYPKLESLSTPCFAAINNVTLMSNMLKMFCLANCFCQMPLTQFKDEKNCVFYDECVYRMPIPVGYYAAQNGCQQVDMTLADIFSKEKQNFLDRLADVPHTPYWTGMTHNEETNELVWDSNDELLSENTKFQNWIDNEDSKTGCPANVLKDGVAGEENIATFWKSDKCSWDQPSYFYFCQKPACSVDNYCETMQL